MTTRPPGLRPRPRERTLRGTGGIVQPTRASGSRLLDCATGGGIACCGFLEKSFFLTKIAPGVFTDEATDGSGQIFGRVWVFPFPPCARTAPVVLAGGWFWRVIWAWGFVHVETFVESCTLTLVLLFPAVPSGPYCRLCRCLLGGECPAD